MWRLVGRTPSAVREALRVGAKAKRTDCTVAPPLTPTRPSVISIQRPFPLGERPNIARTLEVNVRRVSSACLVLPAFLMGAIAARSVVAQASSHSQAPAQQPARMGADELLAFAKLHAAIDAAHDSIDVQLSLPRNKTIPAQKQLQDRLRSQIEEILHHGGMTEEDYAHKTYLVSTDSLTRRVFDSVLVKLTGVPTPGKYVAAATGPVVPVPAGPVGVHIGHVVNAFADTPDGTGLLPMALAEARIAATHAGLSTRQPANLDYMKTHAGHVINALDPTVIATGPGRGYGVNRAANGVATHIELAAKVPGASPNVLMHSTHIATSARNTMERSDQLLALAQQVQAATSAPDAAKLCSQMASLADQLIAGMDANADGKVTWEKGEGGLQQAQDHVTLMLAAEMKPPR